MSLELMGVIIPVFVSYRISPFPAVPIQMMSRTISIARILSGITPLVEGLPIVPVFGLYFIRPLLMDAIQMLPWMSPRMSITSLLNPRSRVSRKSSPSLIVIPVLVPIHNLPLMSLNSA